MTNIGQRVGDEVVQLYTRDVVSSVMTYDKNLRGFERVHLLPEETKTITFLIPPESLSLWTEDHRRIVEPGVFRVMIGNGSEDLRRNKQGEVIDSRQRGLWLTAEFELQ